MKQNTIGTLARIILPVLLIASLVILMSTLLPSSFVSAQEESVYKGVNITGDTPGAGEAEGRVGTLVASIINIFSFVVGIISVIMIIIGGLKYIMSSGDASNVTSAKNTILYAVIGLVVVAFAQIIVLYVLDKTVPAPPAEDDTSLVLPTSLA